MTVIPNLAQKLAPKGDLDDFTLMPKEAAQLLGIGHQTLLEFLEDIDPFTGQPYIASIRPVRRVVLISKSSLLAHKRATRDPLFWANRHAVAKPVQRR